MATKRSKSSPKPQTRTPVTFEMAVHLCPHQGVAESVAEAFGLFLPEYDAIRAEHASAVNRMAEAFNGALNDKATTMHFQRIVGSLVGSAVGAGRFYSDKVSEARAATARAADGGDDEHGTGSGLKAARSRVRSRSVRSCGPAPPPCRAWRGRRRAFKDLAGEDGCSASVRGREEGWRRSFASLPLTGRGDRKVSVAPGGWEGSGDGRFVADRDILRDEFDAF